MTSTQLRVLGHSPVVGDCDLCAQPDAELTATVAILRDGGSVATLAACDRCGRAVRRLAALIGSAETSMSAEMPAFVAHVPPVEPPPVSSEPHLLHEFLERVTGEDGREYTARAYAAGRGDGTWVGWLTFVNVATSEMRSTGPETTQSTREAAAYWASGIEPTYLEGAFKRAAAVTMSAPAGSSRNSGSHMRASPAPHG